jgi:pimeloyl-ACP methyl ester carboxylesterase
VTAPNLDARLVLPDGRALAYCEWGDPDGSPVVFFHGCPGSRAFAPQPGKTRALGARVITFDRPGYGASDRREGREIGDTPSDVTELVDALGLERFAVFGFSVGGGHALACAVAMPDRVTAIALASMPGPLDEVPGAWDALADHYRPTAGVAREEPQRAARAIVRTMAPFAEDPLSYLGGGLPADRAVTHDPEHGPMLERDIREAFRHDAGGMADDLVALWRPWPFAVADAPAGAWLWHGEHDTRAEPDYRYLRRTLPGCRPRTWPDESHLGIVPGWGDVLVPLVAAEETY